MRSLSIGVSQQRTNAAMDRLADQISDAGENLDKLRAQGIARNSVEHKVAKGDYDDLTNRMLRAKYTAKVYPYIKERHRCSRNLRRATSCPRTYSYVHGHQPRVCRSYRRYHYGSWWTSGWSVDWREANKSDNYPGVERLAFLHRLWILWLT